MAIKPATTAKPAPKPAPSAPAKPAPVPPKAPAKAAPAAPKPATPAASAAAPAKAPAKAPAPAAAAPQSSGGSGKDISPALKKQLRMMKDKFNENKAESAKPGGGTTLPPGYYKCQMTNCEMRPGNEDKSPAVMIEWTCIDQDSGEVGEKGTQFRGLGEEQMVWTMRDLRKLGVDVDSMEIEDLPDVCTALLEVAPIARIQVKENGEYINVNIIKLLDESEGGEGGGEAVGEAVEGEVVSDEQVANEEAAEAVEDAAEAAEVVEGEEIVDDGTQVEGEVVEGEEVPVEAEEVPTEAEEQPTEPQIEPGADVQYTIVAVDPKDKKKKRYKKTGVIKKINEDGTAIIKDDESKQAVTVPLGDCQLLAENE